MRKRQKTMLVLAVMAVFMATVLFLPGMLGAGSLDPPDTGSPVPTMRTLEEIYNKLNTIENKIDQLQDFVGGNFTYYADEDGDGYGDANSTTLSVEQPDGYVVDNTDCDDMDSGRNPGAAEVFGNGIDENCDGNDYRFTDLGDGTVRDNKTDLIWLKDADCSENMNWNNAMAEAADLADGQCGLADGSKAEDWRLPTKAEWEALVDRSYSSPALSNAAGTGQWSQGDAFNNVQSILYWSSTTHADYSTDAWLVDMSSGIVPNTSKGYSNGYVWPVRPDN